MKMAMRRFQDGSAGGVVVLAVVVILVWWQWDRIAGMFGAAGAGGLELVDYRCDRQSDGRLAFDGSVRNGSDAPMELRAVTVILESSGKRSDVRESTVRPVPLPPGQVGTFRGDAPPLPDGGSCKLDGFIDAATGHAVRHSGRGR